MTDDTAQDALDDLEEQITEYQNYAAAKIWRARFIFFLAGFALGWLL